MNLNPYAPPQANVSDHGDVANMPALWNPRAAANWSLLFSPAFGAWVHMENWKALGEPAQAAVSKAWVYGSAGFLLLVTILSLAFGDSKALDSLARLFGFGMLLAWYFAHGRVQQQQVEARFGSSYPRKGWAKPLFFAFVGVSAFLGLVFAAAYMQVTVSGEG